MTKRRAFLKSVSAASAGLLATGATPLLAEGPRTPGKSTKEAEKKIHLFSKHLQWLDYEKMAETASGIGFDGVDITVRPGGHVLPENVKRDLPAIVKAIRDNGLLARRMTTAITSAGDPLTLDILETASDLGISEYRLGWFSYDPALSVEESIGRCNSQLRDLAAMNKKLGLTASYQNHAGEMVGGPVWDIGLLLQDVDSDYVGIRYDIRHATVEGGLSWPLGMKYLANRINSFDVKDFMWKETEGKWKPFNVPLGEGMVDFDRYIQLIREYGIPGDFTIHLEYPLGGAEHGDATLTCPPEQVTTAMKLDLSTLRKLISDEPNSGSS